MARGPMDRDYWIEDCNNIARIQQFIQHRDYDAINHNRCKYAFDIPPHMLEKFRGDLKGLQQACTSNGTPLNLETSHLPPGVI